jgi:hypothetical protein
MRGPDDESFGKYILPALGKQLDERRVAASDEGARVTRLPPEALKFVQRSKGLKANVVPDSDDRTRSLHGDGRERSLDDFLSAYEPEFPLTTEDPNMVDLNERAAAKGVAARPHADFLRQKTLRHTEIIQIEFYNAQLKKKFGDEWTERKQLEFVKLLKSEMEAARGVLPADRQSQPIRPISVNQLV